MVKAIDLKSIPVRVAGSNPVNIVYFLDIAQLEERWTVNPSVVGSNPTVEIFYHYLYIMVKHTKRRGTKRGTIRKRIASRRRRKRRQVAPLYKLHKHKIYGGNKSTQNVWDEFRMWYPVVPDFVLPTTGLNPPNPNFLNSINDESIERQINLAKALKEAAGKKGEDINLNKYLEMLENRRDNPPQIIPHVPP